MNNSVPDLIAEIQFDGDPMCSYNDAVTMDAPYLYYRLGEASGNAINSGSLGTGLNATYTGTPTYNQAGALAPPAFTDENGTTITTGYDLNGSILLNGTTQFATIPTSASIDAISTDSTHSWTVEAWIYPTAVRNVSGGTSCIISRQFSASHIPFILGYGFESMAQGSHAGTCAAPTGAQVWTGFFVTGDGWYQCVDPTPLTTGDLNTWIHYVGTWDAIGLTLYRNGVNVHTGVPTAGFTSASSSGLATYIGKRWDSTGTTSFFPGRVDEVGIYPTALSGTQVSAHYAAQRVRINPIWSDISADVMDVQTQRGRTYELDAYQTGTMTMTLDDAARKYDPSNTQSPYNGGDLSHTWFRILPLRPIRIRAAANDLSNPEFEKTLSGTDWVALTSASIAVDSADQQSGTKSLQVTAAASIGSGVRSERVPVVWRRLENGAVVNKRLSDVRTSVWAKVNSGNSVRYYIQELDVSNSVVATSSITTIPLGTSSWTQFILNYSLTNANTTQVQVVFDVGTAVGAVFHIDTVKVAPVWPVFRGFVDAWPETWNAPDYATTQLSAVDGFEPLTQAQLETTTLAPLAQASAVTQMSKLLDLSYWPTLQRYITHSDSVDQSYVCASSDFNVGSDYGLTVLQDVANSELGHFFMGKDGNATFQDRNYRFNIYTVLGDQGSFTDDNASIAAGLAYEYADMQTSFDQQNITNDWTVSLDSSVQLPIPGTARSFDSIRRYLRRSNTRATRLINTADAQAQASNLISRTSGEVFGGSNAAVNPAAILRIENIAVEPMNNRDMWRQALQREISDEIFVSRTPGGSGPGATGSGVSGGFYIEQISWSMDTDSPWRVTWQLSPRAFSIGARPFQLDITPYDNLDQSRPWV